MSSSPGCGRPIPANVSSPSIPSPATPISRIKVDVQKLIDRVPIFWCCLSLLVALGTLGLSPQLIFLSSIWVDPLRSIGMPIMAAGIVLVLRVWRQNGWELRGTWWGLLALAMAFFSILFSLKPIFLWGDGPFNVNFLTSVFPVYLYASGVVLLFAGRRVWQQAWFPLALLLCAQPVPHVVVTLFDLPLQGFSAHVARFFAALIGFPPTNPGLLRLMFTPDFGMFIAPGCDGMRGAVALGYIALIVGYLKRVSIVRWFLYVAGAMLLGHLFNLMRLCALVLYYRIAVGHHALESMAKLADYVIGGFLFMVAGVLFLWVVSRRGSNPVATSNLTPVRNGVSAGNQRLSYWKVAAFAILVLIVAVPGVRAIQNRQESLATNRRISDLTPKELDDLLPKQLGAYSLIRTWQQRSGGARTIETAAYKTDASNEINLGIYLLPGEHTVQVSWLTRGELPRLQSARSFVTARGEQVSIETAFYSDGVTDSLTGDIYCTPSLCVSSSESENGVHFGLKKAIDFSTRGIRAVPIFFIVQAPHRDAPAADIQREMLAESQSFLLNVDLNDLSRRFQ
ncbi:MAG: exosortase J [Terracidiphilus sp.]